MDTPRSTERITSTFYLFYFVCLNTSVLFFSHMIYMYYKQFSRCTYGLATSVAYSARYRLSVRNLLLADATSRARASDSLTRRRRSCSRGSWSTQVNVSHRKRFSPPVAAFVLQTDHQPVDDHVQHPAPMIVQSTTSTLHVLNTSAVARKPNTVRRPRSTRATATTTKRARDKTEPDSDL